ncbi:MAG: aldo/keto reductase [Bryobacterales bacterium]|nr:aldo/keto reductase [Bryobacterales bacterium]
MILSHATTGGTSDFANRFPTASGHGFFREANGWRISSLGLGSYLGGADEETDLAYFAAVIDAFRGGINLFDAAINYRDQRSERSIGSALRKLIRDGEARREEFVVCSKAGFLTPGAVPDLDMAGDDVIRGIHCMRADFLVDQLHRSRENFGLDCLDVYYLHNPETQLSGMERGTFLNRVRHAFEAMELCVAKGWLQAYGVATWDGFRRRGEAGPGLQLAELAGIARELAGENHHFRFIQLPYNLGMVEACAVPNQRNGPGPVQSILEMAAEAGVHVVTSASLLQSRLAQGLPEQSKQIFQGAESDAQRAIQFARSGPNVVSSLVGMKQREHVAENLGVTRFAPMAADLYRRLF